MGRLIGQKLTEQMVSKSLSITAGRSFARRYANRRTRRAGWLHAHPGRCRLHYKHRFFQDPKYDALKDFAPVSVIAGTPYILVVNPGLPYARSLKGFIAAAKAQPGTIVIGSAGSGSGTHMTGELLRLRAGINLTHVPYKSVGPAMADVVAGQIQSTFSTPPTSLPLVKAGASRSSPPPRSSEARCCRTSRLSPNTASTTSP